MKKEGGRKEEEEGRKGTFLYSYHAKKTTLNS